MEFHEATIFRVTDEATRDKYTSNTEVANYTRSNSSSSVSHQTPEASTSTVYTGRSLRPDDQSGNSDVSSSARCLSLGEIGAPVIVWHSLISFPRKHIHRTLISISESRVFQRLHSYLPQAQRSIAEPSCQFISFQDGA